MRLLLVEDDRTAARGLVAQLAADGLPAEVADTATEAFDLALATPYDLILLDLMLPDQDGLDLLRRLRAAGIGTPVVVLSGLASAHAKVKAFTLGADDFMSKPFDREELLARIRAVLRRSKTNARPRLGIGPLSIDLEAQKVTVHDREVLLTGREYGILELLALRRGSVLGKEAFMTHLYSGMDEPEMKIIDVFICKLRRKLADAGAESLIGTIRGRGYVLRDPCAMPQASSHAVIPQVSAHAMPQASSHPAMSQASSPSLPPIPSPAAPAVAIAA